MELNRKSTLADSLAMDFDDDDDDEDGIEHEDERNEQRVDFKGLHHLSTNLIFKAKLAVADVNFDNIGDQGLHECYNYAMLNVD